MYCSVGGVNEDVILYAFCHKFEIMNNFAQGTLKRAWSTCQSKQHLAKLKQARPIPRPGQNAVFAQVSVATGSFRAFHLRFHLFAVLQISNHVNHLLTSPV